MNTIKVPKNTREVEISMEDRTYWIVISDSSELYDRVMVTIFGPTEVSTLSDKIGKHYGNVFTFEFEKDTIRIFVYEREILIEIEKI